MSEAHWEHYSHPADMGIRGFGATKAEAFEQAALAMTAVIADLHTVARQEVVEIVCEEQDDELLFVSWLNALLYEMATRRMLFSKFKVMTQGDRLEGEAWGEELDEGRHRPVVEVKAATYGDLKVEKDRDGNWVAQCVVDV
jgi:SHS2 domain-containing protein